MDRVMRWMVVAALATAGCGGSDPAPIEPNAAREPVQTAVGQSFTLKVGQQARIQGTDLTVSFRGVPSDSRCPVDVQCVWAGNARVLVDAAGAQLGLNTGEDPRSARVDGYQLELTGLEPAPRSDVSIQPGSYAATFVVKRATGT